MPGQLTHTRLEAALDDLKRRTLARIDVGFGQLIYLASTRDYNTGRYYHDGLALHFSEEIAQQALAQAHREVFLELALSPLAEFTQKLERYMRSIGPESQEVFRGWSKLEAYRVVIPMDADALVAGLFLANVKTALPIVETRLRGGR